MLSYFFRLISMFRSHTALHFLHRGFIDVELASFRDAFTTQHIIQILSFSLLLLRCLFPHSTRCYSRIFIFLASSDFFLAFHYQIFWPSLQYIDTWFFGYLLAPISHTLSLTPLMYSISSLLFAITLSFADRSIVLSLRKINYRLFISPV